MEEIKIIELSIPNLEVELILQKLKEYLESGWIITGKRFVKEFKNVIVKCIEMCEIKEIRSRITGLYRVLRPLDIESADEVIVLTLILLVDKEEFKLSKDKLLIKLNEVGMQKRHIELTYQQKLYVNHKVYMLEKSIGEEIDAVIEKLREFKNK